MKLYKGLIYSLSAAVLLTGCAKEDPFVDPSYDGPTGTLMTRCLSLNIGNADGIEASTRAAVPSTDDFKVVIARKNAASSASTYGATPGSVEYNYSEMPEVLTLPADDYKAYAYFGDNKPAAWDEPYYYGESEFGIEANKITDDVDPIVAKLANIRVTIVFHATLLSAMNVNDPNNKVEVKMGDQGTTMTFTPEEKRSAYFKYVDQSQTLVATFNGNVDGTKVVQTKTHDNVQPGNHYRITFKLHGIDDEDPGTISSGVTVDASVEKVDMNRTIDGETEEILDDDWRPTQGGDEPNPPTPPVNEDKEPEITAVNPPAGKVGIDLDKLNEVTENIYCVLKVSSTAEGGITEFNVVIDSKQLTPDELKGMGLSNELDLVNPGGLEDVIKRLGLPVNVGGMSEVTFDITGFMPMLAILGEGTHNFTLTVTDANGSTSKTLRLHTN